MYCRCLEELTICSINITPRQSTLNKLNTVNSDTELKLKKLLDMEVLCLNFFSFFYLLFGYSTANFEPLLRGQPEYSLTTHPGLNQILPI